MSERARAWAKKQTAPCSASKAVLLELAAMADADDVCWPSNRFLGSVLQVTPRSIQRSLLKLKTAGLVVVSARSRDNGGQTSNLYRLPVDGITDAPRYDAADAPPTAPTSSQGRENLREDTSDEVSHAAGDEDFGAWWNHYPKKVGLRGARAQFDRLIQRGHVLVATLVEAARRYAVSVRDRDPKFIKSPANWLAQGCWADDDVPEVVRASSVPREFDGPQELRAAVVTRLGAAWAQSWLDPCAWSGDSREILPRTGFAGDRIRRDLRELLQHFNVRVATPLVEGPQKSKAGV